MGCLSNDSGKFDMSSMASSSSSRGQITNPLQQLGMSFQFYTINFYVELYDSVYTVTTVLVPAVNTLLFFWRWGHYTDLILIEVRKSGLLIQKIGY